MILSLSLSKAKYEWLSLKSCALHFIPNSPKSRKNCTFLKIHPSKASQPSKQQILHQKQRLNIIPNAKQKDDEEKGAN